MERAVILSAGDAAVTCVWMRYTAISATDALPRTAPTGDRVDQDVRSLRTFASALAMAVVDVRESRQCRALVSDQEVDAFMRLVERCRPVWLRRERGHCLWFTFPVPAEALRLASAVADDGPVLRHGRWVPCEIEDAAVGHIAADRRRLDRMSDRQRAEAMNAFWMQAIGEDRPTG